ncbi:hypothetical protein L3X38_013959 [Prunus dulcis]|uniref:Pectinesterase catalytic domain-containing protein n=1 Tax=Prunus dulcis TaxID=3755 RepID=A0AAD4WMA8_PRUDU|nr:hypothetical protein L3X38_013959 [Prunus dulcis]
MRTWLNTSQARETACVEAFQNGIDSKVAESLRQVTKSIDEVLGMIQVQQQHHLHLHNAAAAPGPASAPYEPALPDDSDLAGNVKSTPTYLGRPWGKYARTVFMKSSMSNVIRPEEWNGKSALSTLYYAEYTNNAPGASFIGWNSWLPSTGVPFAPGL